MNVLIIAYYFPPFEGVASRRWAKYAKYLNRMDKVNIHILSNDFKGTSPWDKDAIELLDKITRVPFAEVKKKRYQKDLPVGLVNKILWKLSYLWDKYFGKKVEFDTSDDCIELFYKEALRIIEKRRIDSVIISGGPYKYLELLPKLKEVTDCKYLLDLRDPWPYVHNSEKFTKEEVIRQMELEAKVIDSADCILSVFDSILNKFKTKNVMKISHALDFEDFNFETLKENKSNKLKLVFGGHLYSEHKYFEIFNEFVGVVLQKTPIEAKCYIPENLIPKIDFSSQNLKFLPYMNTAQEFLKEQMNADGVLYIVREKHEQDGNFTTKFHELVMTRKPILYFGPETKVSKYIEKHQLGYVINKENLDSKVNSFLHNLESKKIPKFFDLKPYGFEVEVKKLVNLLETIHA